MTYLTRTTVILLVGLCVVAVWRAWTDWFVVDAAFGNDPLARALSVRDAAGWAYTATLAVTAAVFLLWVWRARANADLLSRAEHRLHRGWVIAGWLVPMINAFMPKVVLEDIWRTSRPDVRPDVRPELLDARDLPAGKLVAAWWLTWAATLFFAVWERAMAIQPFARFGLRRIADANLVFTAAHCLSGALLVIVVLRISRWQTAPRG